MELEDDEHDSEQVTQKLAQRGKLRGQLKQTIDNMEYLQNDLSDIKKPKFQIMNENLNLTFEKISHPRELTLDAVGLKILSNSLKSQALKLSDLSKQYNFDTFAMKLKDLFGASESGLSSGHRQKSSVENQLDWVGLGIEVSCLLATPRTVTTMVGPLEKEEKVRKAPRRRAADEDTKNMVAEKPKELIQTGEEDMNEATNQRVKTLLEVVRQLTDENLEPKSARDKKRSISQDFEDNGPGFDLLKLLVHPTDDVQTIENFFDFSFLIKEKAVLQCLNDDDLPIAVATTRDSEENKETIDNRPKKQMVLTLTTKDLKQLRQLLYGSEGGKMNHPLHRNDQIYKPPSSSSTKSSLAPAHEQKENRLNQAEDSDIEIIPVSRRNPSSSSQGKRKQMKLR